MQWIDRDLERLISRELHPPPKDVTILEIPKSRGHGDLTTTVCLSTRGPGGERGYEWAKAVEGRIRKSVEADHKLSRSIERVEAVRPGFINFFIHPATLREMLPQWILHPGEMGPLAYGKGRRTGIEFVSANPTGPLTIAHGRQAAVGDALAHLMERAGMEVTREYYLNDTGNQIRLLGASVRSEYEKLCGRSAAFPQGGYKGDYIRTLAGEIRSKHGDDWPGKGDGKHVECFSEFAATEILREIRKDLEGFGVRFEVWFSEKRDLHDKDRVRKVLDRLRADDWIKEEDGALWFRSTRSGDDKDRVVRKSDGTYTYLAPDIAYHDDKFSRGFDHVIDILGPDHHGYVPRLSAAVEALGISKARLTVILVQLTTLYRNKEPVRMSTREGEFVTLRELVDEVGRDAARFFFLMRRSDSPLDFDLELAKRHSQENPVYYVQYAHTRIASIIRKARGVKRASADDLERLTESSEIALLRILWQYPYLLAQCARLMAPHLLTVYLRDLATAFHSFYDRHRVVTDDLVLTRARLDLARAVKAVLRDGLGLLGVAAPDKM